jgi:hypothetical protein
MKERKTTVAVALVLLALGTGVYYVMSRSEPAAPTASAPPPAPAAPAPTAAPPELPATPPSAATAAVAGAVPAERTDQPPAARAALASPAVAKEPRERVDRDGPAKTFAEKAKPENGAGSEPVGATEPSPPEPVASAQPELPAQKTPPPEPDGSALGRFEDRVGASFTLARVTCLIDGQTVYSGAGGKSLQLFQRPLPPGSHSVSVIAEYRANSSGVFSYASGYGFKVSSGRRFNVLSGKPVQVNVIGYEKGGPTVEFAERLALAINAR